MIQELNGVKFVISGDEVNADSAVLISNHKSLADHIAMAYLARRSNSADPTNADMKQPIFGNLTLPRINFFSWFRLWKVPSLGVLFNLAKCDENWQLEKSLSDLVFSNLLKSKIPEWIILFPEVNIWTPEDSKLQQKQSEKYFLPVLENVLYPRFSAFYNVISALNNKEHFKFTKLYDLTILYQMETLLMPEDNIGNDLVSLPNRPSADYFVSPTLLQIFSSEFSITVHINVKTKQLARIPKKKNKMEKWLENSWVDKDTLLEQSKVNLSTPTLAPAESILSKNSSLLKTGLFRLSSTKVHE